MLHSVSMNLYFVVMESLNSRSIANAHFALNDALVLISQASAAIQYVLHEEQPLDRVSLKRVLKVLAPENERLQRVRNQEQFAVPIEDGDT